MKRQKDDVYFISRIIDDIDYILSILEGVDLDTFSSNQMMSDSTVFRLIQISENSRGISEDLKNSQEYDWFKVSGMRNRLVHDYGNVDYRVSVFQPESTFSFVLVESVKDIVFISMFKFKHGLQG